MSNKYIECMNRVEKITGKKIPRIEINVNDKSALDKLFKENNFYAVLHLAALKAVGESVGMPLDYYANNVGGSVTILQCMKENNVKNFFSVSGYSE